MAWYPGAVKMELQPESDAQPAIRPTQLIVHSIVAPWTARRTYEYWRDSTSLESHFGLGYEGDLAQYIGTETRADANAGANRRADGTGAVSIETASNTQASDPWTAAQVEELIKLGVWLHQKHGVPLRICRSHSDPGFGYHSLFREWSTSGTACPGKARIAQFREIVFPGIVARAKGGTAPTQPKPSTTPTTENSMDLTSQVALGDWVPKAWPDDKGLADKQITVNTALGSGYAHSRRAAENTAAILKQLEALRIEVAQLRAAIGKA
ncbi:N-acetylmuramoyl-L-alanine amidase [Streptomyces griseoflavus]|uniref:peptidoglycan recognition protein family protein n=1 Tax=Streptomyces griseoflavus TaxID=35619 RepID=UPI0033BD192B